MGQQHLSGDEAWLIIPNSGRRADVLRGHRWATSRLMHRSNEQLHSITSSARASSAAVGRAAKSAASLSPDARLSNDLCPFGALGVEQSSSLIRRIADC